MSLLSYLGYLFVANALTFGNGPVLVPLLQAELVERQHLLSTDRLLYAFTIARVTPGQANLYVAAVGYMLFGIVGAALSVVAILLPGYLMVPLMRGYARVQRAPAVRRATKGLTSASVGLIFAATLDIGRQSLRGPISAGVFALVLAALLLRPRWNAILVLAVASAAGALAALLTGSK